MTAMRKGPRNVLPPPHHTHIHTHLMAVLQQPPQPIRQCGERLQKCGGGTGRGQRRADGHWRLGGVLRHQLRSGGSLLAPQLLKRGGGDALK